MANKLFADRMFFTFNGFEALHVSRGDVRRNRNVQRVETMSRNKRTAGYKFGNLGVQLSLEVDIEQLRAQIDPGIGDPATDVNVVCECGGERYIVKGVIESEMTLSGTVGSGTKSFSFEALDIVNENGTSVNADISLG